MRETETETTKGEKIFLRGWLIYTERPQLVTFDLNRDIKKLYVWDNYIHSRVHDPTNVYNVYCYNVFHCTWVLILLDLWMKMLGI